MAHNPWLELEGTIRAQLALQVALSFDRHHRFMLDHGLDQCRRVVDVGTGNGLFIGRVAAEHPGIAFTGIDDKAHMIAEATSRSIPNVTGMQADALDERTQAVLATADGVCMRYFVLHMPDTRSALPKILRATRPGTRLWIFDLDTDGCVCEPPEEAFTSFHDLVQEFCDHSAVEIRTASRLAPVLEAAGFDVDEAGLEPFDNHTVEPRRFSEYLLREATLYHYFLGGSQDADRLERIRHFLCDVMSREKHYVRYGMAMVAATKRA